MLIRDQDEQARQVVAFRRICASCKKLLDYPYILMNLQASSYHVDCAIQLACDILVDVRSLLSDEDAADLVRRVSMTRFMQVPASSWPGGAAADQLSGPQ
jgi:hypothetical protein